MAVASPNPSSSLFISASPRSLRRGLPYDLIAPVEVPTAPPEPFFRLCLDVLDGFLARPGEGRVVAVDRRLLTIHRLLEPSLLLRLEEGMVVEGIDRLVVADRHRVLELLIPLLELEVVLDHFGEHRRRLNRH